FRLGACIETMNLRSGTAFGVLVLSRRRRRSPLSLRPPATFCQPLRVEEQGSWDGMGNGTFSTDFILSFEIGIDRSAWTRTCRLVVAGEGSVHGRYCKR